MSLLRWSFIKRSHDSKYPNAVNSSEENRRVTADVGLAIKTSSSLPRYLYCSLAILWLYSGIVPVLFAQTASLDMLAQLGIDRAYQMSVFIMASSLDIIFGLLILSRWRYQAWVWLVQLTVVLGYSVIVGVGLPENRVHPFAPLIKNIPIIALLIYMAQRHSVAH